MRPNNSSKQTVKKTLTKQLKDKHNPSHPDWLSILKQHPVDIATLLEQLSLSNIITFLERTPQPIRDQIFINLSTELQIKVSSKAKPALIHDILEHINARSLVHLFENMPNKELEKYLKLSQQKRRLKILASLNCEAKTAGRLVNSDVLTIQKSFTVERSIHLMQKSGKLSVQGSRLYVKDEDLRLVGFIELTDLVMHPGNTPINSIMKPVKIIANAHDEQESIAQTMQRYRPPSIPVLDDNRTFLGIILARNILEVIEEEAVEDTYKMSGLTPTEKSYTQQPFWKLIFQRVSWLAPLLIFQSVSGAVMGHYTTLLEQHTILFLFMTMLIGTGGNAGNQSATLVVRGLVTGEIDHKNWIYVLLKEFGVALAIGSILFFVGGLRVLYSNADLLTTMTISLALFSIVVTSILLGTIIPIALDRIGVDPAHSAAPFLSTLMDIIGISIYCAIAAFFLT